MVVSLLLDPILISWFQARNGNGGMGVCVASVASEALMIAAGIWLLPRGIFHRTLVRGLLLTFLAGGAMVVVAKLLSGVTSFLVAPLAVVAYAVCLWALGGLNKGSDRDAQVDRVRQAQEA